ncbi:substrate-binding periplasmic protein [Paucibacter sp. Y2R2-4]|uniref:substrate-binding periplasmic protein n=1 Tax=Paucibacter sp. Y2R2-4 TaxID=2893553 RepID=UPI0021E42F3F|nr:transporter substrate-binding domain-containing protein [Paucibacter sp. Y2R2-4]MCV2351533.1 transporter substrate-binding domain-containing protein [Paucibacter sp. Y2R2-4]
MRSDRRQLMLAGLALAAGPGRAAPALRIVSEEAPPFNYTENGTPMGLCTELVQAVLKELQLHVPIETLPWARAYDVAQHSSHVLIYSIARTDQREHLFKWVGLLTQADYSLFALASRGLKLNQLSDALQLQTATVNADVAEQFLEERGFVKGRHLQSGSRNELNLEKLRQRRVDLWITADVMARHLARQAGQDSQRLLVRALPLPELNVSFYMAFGQATPDDQVELFRRGLEAIKRNGQYEQIRRKWQGSSRDAAEPLAS